MDIMRTAEKNMIFYQKQIAEVIKGKQLLVAGAAVDSVQKNLEKKFKYYRLSLYIYALASYISMMLLPVLLFVCFIHPLRRFAPRHPCLRGTVCCRDVNIFIIFLQ